MRRGLLTGVKATTLVLLLSSTAVAGPTFQRTYGGSGSDAAACVLATPDGGFVFGGTTSSFGAGDFDFWLVRTDSVGDTLWTRTYGGPQADYCSALAPMPGGGYLLVGRTSSFGGWRRIWVVRTDSLGDTLWTSVCADAEWAKTAAPAGDSGCVVAGFGVNLANDVTLLRYNAMGQIVGLRVIGGPDYDFLESTQAVDGADGYTLAGWTYSFGAGGSDAWLVRTDASGDTLWTRTYGGTEFDFCLSHAQVPGGYLLGATTCSRGAGDCDVWLIRTDTAGDTAWTRTWGGPEWDDCYSIAPTRDGGCLLVGNTSSFGAGDQDIWILRVNQSGDTLWSRTCGGPDYELGCSGRQLADDGYIVAGHTRSTPQGDGDALLLRLDPNGCALAAESAPVEARLPSITTRAQLAVDARIRGLELLDASGRVVRNPSRVSAGVYFLRESGAFGSRCSRLVVAR